MLCFLKIFLYIFEKFVLCRFLLFFNRLPFKVFVNGCGCNVSAFCLSLHLMNSFPSEEIYLSSFSISSRLFFNSCSFLFFFFHSLMILCNISSCSYLDILFSSLSYYRKSLFILSLYTLLLKNNAEIECHCRTMNHYHLHLQEKEYKQVIQSLQSKVQIQIIHLHYEIIKSGIFYLHKNFSNIYHIIKCTHL